MKAIDYLLLGAGGYFLYLLMSQKESTGPVQDIPVGSIDNHIAEKITNTVNTTVNTKTSLDNKDSHADTIQASPNTVQASQNTAQASPNAAQISPNTAQVLISDKLIQESSVKSNTDRKCYGADSYLVSTGIPNLFGLFGSEQAGRVGQDVISKSALPKDSDRYDLQNIPFYSLSEGTKTILLRCFASDYTSPRMIKDDTLYNNAIAATNKTGAPAGWVQYISCLMTSKGVSVNSDSVGADKLSVAAVKMLEFCEYAATSNKTVNLSELRNNAIAVGLQALQP